MAERTLDVIINGQDNLSRTLEGIEKNVGGFSKGMERATGPSKALAAGLGITTAAVGAFGALSVKAANESESAQKRLETLLMNVDGATLDQADALRALAKQQMAKTTLDDDAIIAGQSQLATFQLQADTIAQLTPAMDDLAVAANGVNVSGDQMIDIGNLVGKAMQGQVGALTRYGVSMNEAQEEILKTGTESQKAATLVEVLNQNFGGLAEGMKNTTEGQLATTNIAFGNLQEAIGGALQPAIRKVTEAITSFINTLASYSWEDLVAIWEKYETPILIIAGALAMALVPALWAAVTAIAATVVALAPLLLIGAGITAAILLLKKAWEQNWGGIQEKTFAVINAIKPLFESFLKTVQVIWGKIQTVVTTVVTAISTFIRNNWTAISAIAKGIWDQFSAMIQAAWAVISGIIKTALAVLRGDWSAAWMAIKETFTGVWDALKLYLNGVLSTFKGVWAAIRDTVIGIIDGIIAKIDALKRKMQDLVATSYKSASGKEFSVWDEIGSGRAFGFAKGGIVPGTGYGDTVPAMLTPGEEVLTKSDPRHAANGGGGMTVIINNPTVRNDGDLQRMAKIVSAALHREYKRVAVGMPA